MVQTARGDGQGAVHDACYVEQWCLVLLMSADAMGAMLQVEPGPQEQGCDGRNDLAVKVKAFMQWRSGVVDRGGRATRLQAGARSGERCGRRRGDWIEEVEGRESSFV